MIVHDHCGGTILFETRQEALAALAQAGQQVPPEPTEIRQLYCSKCRKYWPKKSLMWKEAHSAPDA